MSVRNTVLTLLKRHKMSRFTLAELRERCKDVIRSKSPTHFNSLTYKTLWMMEKKGLLTVVQQNPESEKVFSLTEQGVQLLETIELIDESPQKVSVSDNFTQDLSDLISELSKAFIEADSEAKQYQYLSTCAPHLWQFLQNRYIDAKTRAAQLKGRLIATENTYRESCNEPTSMAN